MRKELLFVSSLVSLGVICSAIAEPSNSSNVFPTDGYMLEDYNYIDAATADNMDDTYDGEVDANPYYDDNLYEVLAGKYLPADSEETAYCPSGSYCPGLAESVKYDENNAQGLMSCPVGYPKSDTGSTADIQCYTDCTTSAFAHSLSVSGNDYYGTGVDTCEITACERGYHVKDPVPDLTNLIGLTGAGTASAYIKNDGTGSANAATYGLSSENKNTFVVDYGAKGRVKGMGRCSTQTGSNNNSTWSNPSIKDDLADEAGSGKHCWCTLNGYTSSAGSSVTFSSPWIFNFSNSSTNDCMEYCADYCATSLRNSFSSALAFRTAIFNTVVAAPASCDANVIKINWYGTTTEDIEINNAGTVQYGGNIRTPRAATPVKGKTFRGWRFEKKNP